MTRVALEEGGSGYIVSEKYAAEHKADFLASLTDYQPDIDFWTPSPDDIVVAERVFRQWIEDGAKDPAAVYPEMGAHPENFSPGEPEFQQKEMALIAQNYGRYARQYAGLIVQGRKVILCNYFAGLEANPAGSFVFMQNVFVPHKGIHFVQGWFDPDAKSCSKLVMVGLWQKDAEDE